MIYVPNINAFLLPELLSSRNEKKFLTLRELLSDYANLIWKFVLVIN